MYNTERIKEMIKMLAMTTILVILFSSTSTKALPAKRSSSRDIMIDAPNNDDQQMYMSEGIVRDIMLHAADSNRDNKLSEGEIAWFYRNIPLYNDYVSALFGRRFIQIADMNHDNLLDSDELLQMLVAMEASDWTKRR